MEDEFDWMPDGMAALLWDEDNGFHIALPSEYSEQELVPEQAGVLATLAIRLLHDREFYSEQVAWMEEQMEAMRDRDLN